MLPLLPCRTSVSRLALIELIKKHTSGVGCVKTSSWPMKVSQCVTFVPVLVAAIQLVKFVLNIN